MQTSSRDSSSTQTSPGHEAGGSQRDRNRQFFGYFLIAIGTGPRKEVCSLLLAEPAFPFGKDLVARCDNCPGHSPDCQCVEEGQLSYA